MDNFKIIYKILSTLEKSMDLEQCNSDSISPNPLIFLTLKVFCK